MLTHTDVQKTLKQYLTVSSLNSGKYSLDVLHFPKKIVEDSIRDFVTYMVEVGWEQYNKLPFLRTKIKEFGKKLGVKVKQYLKSIKEEQEFTDMEIENRTHIAVSKWKGNVFEMIVLFMLDHFGASRFLDNTNIESWMANDAEDNGSDGYLAYNDKLLVGVNVKYRWEEEIDDNSKVLKTPERTLERMKAMKKKGEITKDEWSIWGDLDVITLCFTTTRPKWYMEKETTIKWITEREIYELIGHHVVGSDLFWKNLLTAIS